MITLGLHEVRKLGWMRGNHDWLPSSLRGRQSFATGRRQWSNMTRWRNVLRMLNGWWQASFSVGVII